MTIIVLIFVVLPPITSITFSLFNCVKPFNDNQSYLAMDVDIQCWSGSHNDYAKKAAIPSVIFWVVGLPVLALLKMFFMRKQLQEPENLASYGFLYLGLKGKSFYWEILLHFRKVAMISINVFFTTFKPLYRALIGFMLMIIYIEFLQKIEPYSTKEINNLELKANLAAFATFYGGLFFISEDIPIIITVLLFTVILLINVSFWLSWIKLTFSKLYMRVHDYFVSTCCPNRGKKAGNKDGKAYEESPD